MVKNAGNSTKLTGIQFFLRLRIINFKNITMKKKKSKIEIHEARKNNKFLKLFENIPYNNSKVGQAFVMKVSSRNKKIRSDFK